MKIHDPMNFRTRTVRWPQDAVSGSWAIFLFLTLLLSGCAAPAQKTTYGLPGGMPPVVTTMEQAAQLPAPAQPPLAAEQKTAPPSEQGQSREPQSGPAVEMVPVMKVGTPDAHRVDYIEQRLALYEKKFQRWLELESQEGTDSLQLASLAPDSCLDRFDTLLSGYTALRDRLRSANPTTDMATLQNDMQEILQLDIAFLESDCAKRLSSGAVAPEGARVANTNRAMAATQAENLIDRYYNEEDYEQVIAAYQLLTKTYPAVTPSPLCTKQYGLARLYTGDIEGATDIFRRTLTVLDAENQIMEPWALQRLTADLLLADGRPAEARTLYEKLLTSSESFNHDSTWATRQIALIDELDVTDPQMTYYLDLMRSVLVFNRNNHSPLDLLAKADQIVQTFPNSPVADNAIQIREDVENQLREWSATLLKQVDGLVEKKEFQQALDLLAKMSTVQLPANLQEQVQQATNAVKTAEKQEQETQRLLREKSLAMQWKSSNDLLDSQSYDSAIAGSIPLTMPKHAKKFRRQQTWPPPPNVNKRQPCSSRPSRHQTLRAKKNCCLNPGSFSRMYCINIPTPTSLTRSPRT